MTLPRLRPSLARPAPPPRSSSSLVVAACRRAGAARARAAPGATPTCRPAPSRSSRPSPADPLSLLAWLFTPIFQAFFILLVVLDKLTGNIAIAIILMTLVIRSS